MTDETRTFRVEVRFPITMPVEYEWPSDAGGWILDEVTKALEAWEPFAFLEGVKVEVTVREDAPIDVEQVLDDTLERMNE